MAEVELVDKRTQCTKTFYQGVVGGRAVFRAHMTSGPMHYQDDPFVEGPWKDIKRNLQPITGGWTAAKMDYQVTIYNSWVSPTAKSAPCMAEFRRGGRWLRMAPVGLFWTNDAGQLQVVGKKPSAATGTLDADSWGVTWSNLFGPGLHFSYRLGPVHFEKIVTIDSLVSLTVPTIGAKGRRLVVQMALTWDSQLQTSTAFTDAITLDDTPASTATPTSSATATLTKPVDLAHRDVRGNLWWFHPPKGWDTTAPFELNWQLKRVGNVVLGTFEVPYATISAAVFPLSVDAVMSTQQVSASLDDAQDLDGTTWSNALIYAFFGKDAANHVYDAWFRFARCPIPNAATIVSSTLTFKCVNAQSGATCKANIRAEAADSATQFLTHAAYAAASWTAALSWNPVPAWPTSGGWYLSPDVSIQVQAVVNRAGWAVGNAMGFAVKNALSDASARRQIYTWDQSGNASGPKLDVTYTTTLERHWLGASTSWNDTNNWSQTAGGAGGAGVPDANSVVIFDSGGNTPCTLDVNATCMAFYAVTGYTNTITVGAHDVAIGLGGFYHVGGTITAGSGTWTCTGSWFYVNTGTWTRETSTVVLSGTAQTLGGASSSTENFYNLTLSGTITVYGGTVNIYGPALNVSGTVANNGTIVCQSGNALTLDGTLQGTGALDIYPGATLGTGGTLNNPVRFVCGAGATGMPVRTYGSNVTLFSNSSASDLSIILGAGIHNITGNFLIQADGSKNCTADASADPTVNIGGYIDFTGGGAGSEVILAGNGTWTVAGSKIDLTGGTLTPGGSTFVTTRNNATCTITSAGNSFNNFTVNQAGGSAYLVFADDFICYSLYKQDGLTSTGAHNVTIGAGGYTQDTSDSTGMGSQTWTCAGNFSVKQFSQSTGATLVMTGAGATLNIGAATQSFYNLTISGTVEMTGSGVYVTHTLNVSGTLTLSFAGIGTLQVYTAGSSVVISGTITGTKYLTILGSATLDTAGTLSCPVQFYVDTASMNMPARIYGNDVYIHRGNNGLSVIMLAGTHTITGNLSIYGNTGYTVTLDGATNNPTANITGAIDFTGDAGSTTITAGNGTWTVGGSIDLTGGTLTPGGSTFVLNGTANQTVTSAANSFYKMTVANTSLSPGVTFVDALTTTDQFKDITPSSVLTFTAGTASALHDINLNGGATGTKVVVRSTNPAVAAGWNVTHNPQTAVSYVSASWNDASAGQEIQADDGTNFDGGNTTNWKWPPGGVVYTEDGLVTIASLLSDLDTQIMVEEEGLTVTGSPLSSEGVHLLEDQSLTATTSFAAVDIQTMLEAAQVTAQTLLSEGNVVAALELVEVTVQTILTTTDIANFVEAGAVTAQTSLSEIDQRQMQETIDLLVSTVLDGTEVLVLGEERLVTVLTSFDTWEALREAIRVGYRSWLETGGRMR